jgi:collagen beta-1,O-galactosyltransferase
MVHSSVLVNLRHQGSTGLTYLPEKLVDYDGPFDDIITFAISAFWNDVTLTACNDEVYGYVMLPQDDESR